MTHFKTMSNLAKLVYVLVKGPDIRIIGPLVAYAKTKTQISFAVTAKLISAFVFAA